MARKKVKKQNGSLIYSRITSLLLGVLIIVLFLGIFGGIVKTFIDLKLLLSQNVEISLRQTLVNTLVIFALVELLRTALNYLAEGRVRVTFIIDTVLIIMLNEVISFWFRGNKNIMSFAILLITILVLMGSRILAIRYSPEID